MHLPAWSSLPNTHYRVSAKWIMFNAEWKLFVCQEPEKSIDLPGGWIDHEETAIEWLSREVEEELWFPPQIWKQPLATWIRKRHNGVRYFFIWYPCIFNIEQFKPSEEATTYYFLSLQEIIEFYKQNPIIEDTLHYIVDHYDELLHMYRNTDFNS